MEDKYKLQEVNKIQFQNYIPIFLIVEIPIILISVMVLYNFVIDPQNSKTIMMFFYLTFINIIFFGSIVLFSRFPKTNSYFKKIKEIGKKEKAYIVDTGCSVYGKAQNEYYYISVIYNEEIRKIYRFDNNIAYKILKILLDDKNFSAENNNKGIPVDIYVDKNKIYVELESINLSEVTSYEEAKNTVLKSLEK